MRKKIGSPPERNPQDGAGHRTFLPTAARGLAVLNSPWLNKGTAFSSQERKSLQLTGLLPPEVTTLEVQAKRAYMQYERLPDTVSKNIYLTAVHDRNEVLFYRLLTEHLREMIPIVNDVTVGLAMVKYHHESRRPRGVYLSIDHIDGIEESFLNFGAGREEVNLILATDAENILGIGDWGLGGIEVSIGKLAICTAAGGVDPRRSIPVMLDVGTNSEVLLQDEMYVGNRHKRIRGERYMKFIDAYVTIASKLFPRALFQWEDFAPSNGRAILNCYQDRVATFNDDMQGTGAITLAAAISACRVSGLSLKRQRIVIFGAGTAGIGVADQLLGALVREGLSPQQALAQIWCVDRSGLLHADAPEHLLEYQLPYARPSSDMRAWAKKSASWSHSSKPGQGPPLAEVIHLVHPTILIGAAGSRDAFTEAMIREMAAFTDRPIIFVLSNPAANAEASPADLIAWTEGRGLLASGCSRGPVTYKGTTYVIGQLSNAMIYPGLVLGAIVCQTARISNGMFAAAASAVSSLVAMNPPGASLLPHIDDMRAVSATVALAVGDVAIAEGLCRADFSDLNQAVQAAMWKPDYQEIRAI
jgi:malate dehydrogenase (oxaloacetate-decarboxylating)